MICKNVIYITQPSVSGWVETYDEYNRDTATCMDSFDESVLQPIWTVMMEQELHF